MTAATASAIPSTDEATDPWPLGEVLRDISRGGLAGLIVGVAVVGLGSRLMMRVAAILVPSADGAITESGFEIGTITLSGSLGLIVFLGPLSALFLATIWVSISPWLPGPTIVKGLLAIPVALAFGTRGLVDGDNPDFIILRHDPAVLAVILGLIALTAPAMALTDAMLDRHLPHPAVPGSRAGTSYTLMSAIGAIFGGLIALQLTFSAESWPVGLTLAATALLTLGWWTRRVRGQTAKPWPMVLAARLALIAGTVASFVLMIPHLEGALGLR